MPVEALVVQASYVGGNLDKGLQGAQKELAATAKEAGKLDSTLAKGLNKGSNQAAFALQNLGRVAQDAPFGFIGIQNNINPLLESFQRLKVESGSTGGALKALAGSLVGAGGLGLAVSVATGLLTVLVQQGFFKAKKGADETSQANKKLKESYDSIISSLTEEQVKVDQIVNALKTETLTRAQRNEAISQLQKVAPEYFATLNKENATIGQITLAYDKFSASILKSIESRAREKELLTVTEEILKLQDKATKLGEDEVLVNGKLVKVSRQIYDSNSETLTDAEAYQATIKGTLALTTEENKRLQELEKTRARLLKLVTQSKGAEQFNVTAKNAATSAKNITTITDVLAELEKEISFLNKKEIAFNTNESKAKISAFFSTAEKLIKDFNVDPKNTIITKLFGRAADVKIVDTLKLLERFSANNFIPPPIEIPLQIIPKLPGESIFSGNEQLLTVPPIQVERFKKEAFLLGQGFNTEFVKGLNDGQLDKAFNELTERISQNQSLVSDVISTFGEGIGKSIAQGGSFISSAFSSILNIIGDFLIKLGRAAILQSKLILAIGAGNPISGLAAGLAAVIAGSILKSIQLPAFATGGTAPGGSILVGERGPEIITAPRGATITPNAQTNAMLSGAGGGTVVFRIQGRELVGVLNNTNATLGRNGQG
jgi:hypothetical protein